MAAKQIIILGLIVCLPLALFAWLGDRLVRQEQTMVRQQFRDLLADKLRDTDRTIAGYFTRTQRELLDLTELQSLDTASLREFVRQQPRVSQVFVLEKDGRLLHPPLDAPRNASEQEFLHRAEPFLVDRDLVRLTDADRPSASGGRIYGNSSPRESAAADQTHGWYVWYWGRGLNLIFFRRLESGRVIGVELLRARWMADLIGELPQTVEIDQAPAAASRIQLVDSGANVVYQWGTVEPAEGAEPMAEIPLSSPLSSWRLRYFVDEKAFAAGGRSAYFNLFSALVVAGIGLAGLAVYFYRESTRELREANTRVNFVNQVSHELKTPLTNIRLYADLLEADLLALDEKEAAGPRERLKVIVSESGRLSRLIGNVLTFAKLQRKQVARRVKPGRVDETIRGVIERFEPAMAQTGIEIRFQAGAGELVELDADALEQILVNLLSNVEKYAAAGQSVEIVSSHQPDRTIITVADEGPGIDTAAREKVFQPFFRLSDRLEDTAGAGIGLSIARNLARLHGGNVRLVPSERGAKFEVDLHTPSAESKATP
ncbi:MAG: HAMP domain-containing histidine kinase [Planctomycetes bacterium]|nr:HAMP domain-containing histidine kinase [Planctomycetota bacterium]